MGQFVGLGRSFDEDGAGLDRVERGPHRPGRAGSVVPYPEQPGPLRPRLTALRLPHRPPLSFSFSFSSLTLPPFAPSPVTR